MSDYVIIKRGYYYRPKRAGYTSFLASAGKYTLEEAMAEPNCSYKPVGEAERLSDSATEEDCLSDKITRLCAENEQLREAATHAAATFDWYADLHRAKGPEHQEKTRRNEDEAALLRAALGGEEPLHE